MSTRGGSMRRVRWLRGAANLLLLVAVGVAVAGLVEAVRGAVAGRVIALLVAALTLWGVGAGLRIGARQSARSASPHPVLRPPGGGAALTPDDLLLRYPRVTLRWLRGQLGLSRVAFAKRLGASHERVAGWEALGRAIEPRYHQRLLPLLACHLATPEGRVFARSLGRGQATESEAVPPSSAPHAGADRPPPAVLVVEEEPETAGWS